MSIKLIIVGAAGRMGNRIAALATESGDFEIVGAIDHSEHSDIGKKFSFSGQEVVLSADFPESKADVVIDFSLPQALNGTIRYCLSKKVALVCGTTGINEQQKEQLKAASKEIPILHATNMSVGMNVLFSLVGQVASILGENYDIEIVEQHHRFKKDAPSGTAMTLAENICKATGRDFPDSLDHGRSGKDALRQKGQIGMHAVRAGDITGVHSIMFAALGETVTINHTASNRDTFVHGALRAAKWIIDKQPAFYSMADVLEINTR